MKWTDDLTEQTGSRWTCAVQTEKLGRKRGRPTYGNGLNKKKKEEKWYAQVFSQEYRGSGCLHVITASCKYFSISTNTTSLVFFYKLYKELSVLRFIGQSVCHKNKEGNSPLLKYVHYLFHASIEFVCVPFPVFQVSFDWASIISLLNFFRGA